MTTPKKITEAQAQELAKKWKVFIAVDEDEEVWWYRTNPIQGNTGWSCVSGYDDMGILSIRISSTLPWTEQIWRPE